MSLDEGFAAWNRGEPLAAHEAFEAAWRETPPGDRRTLLHALAQLGAVGHKLVSGVRVGGAAAVLARARVKLESLPDEVEGVDVPLLLEVAERLSETLRARVEGAASAPHVTLPSLGSRRPRGGRSLPDGPRGR